MYILVLQCQSSSNTLYSKLIHQSPFLCVFALGKSLAQGRTQQKNSRFHSDHSWKHLSCTSAITSLPEVPSLADFPSSLPFQLHYTLTHFTAAPCHLTIPPAAFLQAVIVLCLYLVQPISNKTVLMFSPWTSPWFPIIFCLFSRPTLTF